MPRPTSDSPVVGSTLHTGADRDLLPSDADLIERVRSAGSATATGAAAYSALLSRHHASARRLAESLVGADRAPALLDATAAQVAAVLDAGGGPEIAFRPYLLGTLRQVASGAPAAYEPAEALAAATGSQADASSAYAALPERWQTVLWHIDIEGESPEDTAAHLGIEPGAVPDLLATARAELAAGTLPPAYDPACEAARRALPGADAGTLARIGRRRLDLHLRDCAACTMAAAQVRSVHQDVPAALGVTPRRPPRQRQPAPVAAAPGGRATRTRRWVAAHPSLLGAPAIALIAVAGVLLTAQDPPERTPPTPDRQRRADVALPEVGRVLTPLPTKRRAATRRAKHRAVPAAAVSTPQAPAATRTPAPRPSPTHSAAPATADVSVQAAPGSGQVTWQVGGLPAGTRTTLVVTALHGATLADPSNRCAGSGTTRLTCPVSAATHTGSFTVSGLLVDHTVRLDVAAVRGYRDPDSANNSTTSSG